MANKASKNIKEPDCCGEKGCCQSQNNNEQPKGTKQWWKIAVFGLGVLLIIGATAYSLITRQTAASDATVDTSAIPQVAAGGCGNALLSLGIDDLAWAQELTSMFSDSDFIFVILPGNDNNSNNTLTSRISEATSTIEARGARIGTFTLGSDIPEFSLTLQRLAVEQLPAVLAISASGNGAIMIGDITEGKLLQTYVTISQPVCAPGSSPGCCPK